MKKLFLIITCMLVVGVANASDFLSPEANAKANAVGIGVAGAKATVHNNVGVRNKVGIQNSVKNATYIDSSNQNKQKQLQAQKQKQAQGQLQGQQQSANNTGNYQSISFDDERQAPAIGGPASGPCTGISGGLSVIGGALNFASVDEECEKREAARVAHMLGAKEIAYKVLMSLDAVKSVMEEQQEKVASRVEKTEKVGFSAGGDTF